MSLVNRLMDQLKQRGLSVEPGREPGQLLLCGPDAEKTPEVVAAVKKFKPQLLRIFNPEAAASEPSSPPKAEPEICRVCGADVSDPETRALMIHPLHCDRGGASKGATDGHGFYHPPAERCPFKEGRAA